MMSMPKKQSTAKELVPGQKIFKVDASHDYIVAVALADSVKGLHIEGYSVPYVLNARDGIPLKEI